MICTKLHEKPILETKNVSNIFWVILDLNSGISVLPLSQSKEIQWHNSIKKTIYSS